MSHFTYNGEMFKINADSALIKLISDGWTGPKANANGSIFKSFLALSQRNSAKKIRLRC